MEKTGNTLLINDKQKNHDTSFLSITVFMQMYHLNIITIHVYFKDEAWQYLNYIFYTFLLNNCDYAILFTCDWKTELFWTILHINVIPLKHNIENWAEKQQLNIPRFKLHISST